MNDEHDKSVVPPGRIIDRGDARSGALPRPVEAEDPALRAIGVAGVVLVTVGGSLLPLSLATSSTRGATRSAKLKWEARESEIRQALADERAALAGRAPRARFVRS